MSSAKIFVDVLSDLFPKQTEICVAVEDQDQLLVYEGNDFRSYLRTVASHEAEPFDGFLVKNAQNRKIYLLAVDACFFASDGPKRCDCLVFDDECLCFVELKINVRRRQAKTRLQDALEQLGESIQFFKSNVLCDLRLSGMFHLEAYSVMQSNVYPRHSASRANRREKFLNEHKIALFEVNVKVFGTE